MTALREQWGGVHENAALDELAAEVVAGESDPYAAADLLLESLEAGAASARLTWSAANPAERACPKASILVQRWGVRELGALATFPRLKEHPMTGALKKTVVLLVVLFLGFWLVQDPNGFGDSAKQTATAIWDLLVQLFDGIISFFKSISS